MSKREEKSWSLWCDWPDCDYQFESGDYSIFGDGYEADEIVVDDDGQIGVDGTHYCHQHLSTWESDHEEGDPYPAPPFLLIREDDGSVSLIRHLHDANPCLPGAVCPTVEAAKEAAQYDALIEVTP